jgi:hypothetical protein
MARATLGRVVRRQAPTPTPEGSDARREMLRFFLEQAGPQDD